MSCALKTYLPCILAINRLKSSCPCRWCLYKQAPLLHCSVAWPLNSRRLRNGQSRQEAVSSARCQAQRKAQRCSDPSSKPFRAAACPQKVQYPGQAGEGRPQKQVAGPQPGESEGEHRHAMTCSECFAAPTYMHVHCANFTCRMAMPSGARPALTWYLQFYVAQGHAACRVQAAAQGQQLRRSPFWW
jgi:hypothetical protein